MNETGYFLDILKFTIAGIIVFFAGWYFIRTYLDEYKNRDYTAIKKAAQQQILPLRLQAYERIILFLERINPSNMLIRLHVSGMSAREMQHLILSEVRQEYQHNIAQQLYVSNHSWKIVNRIKEDTIAMINNAAKGLPEHASATDMSRIILTHLADFAEDNPYTTALTIVKQDIQKLF